MPSLTYQGPIAGQMKLRNKTQTLKIKYAEKLIISKNF